MSYETWLRDMLKKAKDFQREHGKHSVYHFRDPHSDYNLVYAWSDKHKQYACAITKGSEIVAGNCVRSAWLDDLDEAFTWYRSQVNNMMTRH